MVVTGLWLPAYGFGDEAVQLETLNRTPGLPNTPPPPVEPSSRRASSRERQLVGCVRRLPGRR